MSNGLLWYRCDVRFLHTSKIRATARKAGEAAGATVATIAAIMAQIYGEEGYYMPFDEWTAEQIAADAFLGEGGADAVRAVVAAALDVGFFDKAAFEASGVLTSKEIQAEWLEAFHKMRSWGKDRCISKCVKPEIWLLTPDEVEGTAAGGDTTPALPNIMEIVGKRGRLP